MNTHAELERRLLTAYSEIFERNKEEVAKWAVHKISPDKVHEPVAPTIPFVGKKYAEQDIKILVYASAETLNDYCFGCKTDRVWLDVDSQASNRHRKCFNESTKPFFPEVHITPMNNGSLATAVMYLSHLIRHIEPKEPREFFETIAFGNYSKFSIETKYQAHLRNNQQLTNEEKRALRKEFGNRNIDTADKNYYLTASHDYIIQDISILKPDYIIMPNMNDNDFIDSIKGTATKVEIYQLISRVIHNMGEGKTNNRNRYKSRDIKTLPDTVQTAYHLIENVNHEKYCYVFDHLDIALNRALNKM